MIWFPFDLIIFDCDSTLSRVEGIDELARWVGREAEVAALTNHAMNGDLPLEAVYGKRLELLQPTRDHLRQLGRLYQETIIPDAKETIAALQRLGHKVFIVSGGLAAGVQEFGVWLGVPESQIFAVEVEFNQLAGRWWENWKTPHRRNLDERYLEHDHGPLTIGRGKADIIQRLRAQHRGRAMLIGDGVSDLEAGVAVDLFVGFGGVVAREKVQSAAPVFIHSPTLAPVLPLAYTRAEVPAEFAALYAKGIDELRESVSFRDPAQRAAVLQRLA